MSLILRIWIVIMCRIDSRRIVTLVFPLLPMGLESIVQFAGEAFQLSPSWVRVISKPISSITTLRQHPDCDRKGLRAPDRDRSCPQNRARFNSLMEGERYLVFPRNIQRDMFSVSSTIHIGYDGSRIMRVRLRKGR